MAAKRTPVTLPKPRVTPVANAERMWDVDFRNGAKGTICQSWDNYAERWCDDIRWSVTHADGSEDWGVARTDALAFACAWAAAAKAPAPVDLSADEVAEMADAAEHGSAAEAAKIMRKLLRMRTGYAWSVRADRGTAAAWLSINATPKRCDGYYMTAHDAAMLSSVLGDCHVRSVSIRPCRGVRSYYVWKIAGLPVPDSLEVAPRSWD